MAKDEFQIPQHFSETDIRAQLDAIQYSPEKQPAPYQHIKDIEEKIFSFREAALALEKKPKGWLSGLVFTPQNETLHELIEKESHVIAAKYHHTFIDENGKKKPVQFGTDREIGITDRFWLDNKSSHTVFQTNVADWYQTRENPSDPKSPIVLRFQTTPHTIYKIYNGIETALTLQDLDSFTKMVDAYAKEVLPLYPLDQALDDLADDESDVPMAA